ncbi:BPSS1780 family membrane protein [Polynucleobacter sp. AP-Sanab-80-C2]|uniref:BPSS1780 family membrane protein n=1 Tax=Polynucleobacter sp. AP-Sanab-80-C2 TaxID=3108274 RepID=UPI002B230202|nr:BPSS1780 family membrane protein [Polynucleobacter sp. AP-Sanab-80-C2]MEA9600271.1 BPSS1780 family membrane protein [Polynucleobacter sp. AP-Sanab-80-C2]
MKLNTVAPKEGYTWIRQGIWLFKQNPLGFLMLVFMYIFAAQLAVIIPVIGVFAVLLLTPTLSVGFMTACRQAIQKERIRPTVYLVALQSGELIRKRILQLGLIYAALILLLSFVLSLLVDFEMLIPLLTSDTVITPEALRQIYLVLLFGAILYIPIAMLMWFSPVLVAWADMSVSQALFSSWLACWTNKGAFFFYLSIWSVVLIAIPLTIGILFDALDFGQAASFLVAPISMAGLTLMHCSFYATWKACFTEDEVIL